MANNGKSVWKCDADVYDDIINSDGLIVAWNPDVCAFDFERHNPIKRDEFHADLDEVFLEYKADVNRQKADIFVAKADEYVAQAVELRACGTPEERKVLAKKRSAENILADSMGITVDRLRELLSATAE